jgi:hypothetical protein
MPTESRTTVSTCAAMRAFVSNMQLEFFVRLSHRAVALVFDVGPNSNSASSPKDLSNMSANIYLSC